MAVGSPIANFLIARRQVRACRAAAEATLQLRSHGAPHLGCERFYNIVSAADPVSHLCAPLIRHGRGSRRAALRPVLTLAELADCARAPPTPTPVPTAKALATEATREEVLAWVRGQIDGLEECVDLHMATKWAFAPSLSAGTEHARYWFSPDVALFTLGAMLGDWAASEAQRDADFPLVLDRGFSSAISPRGSPVRPFKPRAAASPAASTTASGSPLGQGARGAPGERGGGASRGSARGEVLPSPSPLSEELPLDMSGDLEVLSEVTGRFVPILALLQQGHLYLLPWGSTVLPKLKGSIPLARTTLTPVVCQRPRRGGDARIALAHGGRQVGLSLKSLTKALTKVSHSSLSLKPLNPHFPKMSHSPFFLYITRRFFSISQPV